MKVVQSVPKSHQSFSCVVDKPPGVVIGDLQPCAEMSGVEDDPAVREPSGGM
jgi:hypothetical protein